MRQRGFQLVEAVVVLAVVASSLVVATPPLLRWTSALRLRLATAEFVSTLRLELRDDPSVHAPTSVPA